LRRKNTGAKLDKDIVGAWVLDSGKTFVFKESGESEFPIPNGSGKELGSFVTRKSQRPWEIDYLMSGSSIWFLGIYDIDPNSNRLTLEWGSPPL
jgi:hypothetical protein